MSDSDFTYEMTGFQSACAEYSEEALSLDKRYLTNRPATFIIEAKGDSRLLGIKSGDKLVLDRSLTPKEDDIVLLVVRNEFQVARFKRTLLQGQDPESGDFVWGVVTTLIREFR